MTGSADKNIKIWGLDFGDCHRSLHAHADSVMAAAFVPGTHYLFTAGKDRLVKYWDADKFEHLLTLQGHCAEVGVVVWGGWVNVGAQGLSARERCSSRDLWSASRLGGRLPGPHPPAAACEPVLLAPNQLKCPLSSPLIPLPPPGAPWLRCGAWRWAAWATW